MTGIEEWWSAGERVSVQLGGAQRSVFVRRIGGGPSMTLLHGFPSSSHDWARIAPGLGESHSLLMCDFLGFGASDKPADHDYSIHEQADLVQALWAREGITATTIVAHDYAVSVTQELLARAGEGTVTTDLLGVHMLNGGVYPELHRPEPTQIALLDPESGPQISTILDEELLVAGLRPTFAEEFDPLADSTEMWRGMANRGGNLIAHRLIRYLEDRVRHRERWIAALESTEVPLAFEWGMLDPISGEHMAQRIAERLPRAPLLALADVCHWPALEAPQRVLAAILDPGRA